MELFESIPYMFEEESFDIRIYYDDATINVLAFLNGYPANGYLHLSPSGCCIIPIPGPTC